MCSVPHDGKLRVRLSVKSDSTETENKEIGKERADSRSQLTGLMVRVLLPAAVPSAAASHHWVPRVLPPPPLGSLGSLSGWVIVGTLPRPGGVNSCCVAITFQALPDHPLLLTGRGGKEQWLSDSPATEKRWFEI